MVRCDAYLYGPGRPIAHKWLLSVDAYQNENTSIWSPEPSRNKLYYNVKKYRDYVVVLESSRVKYLWFRVCTVFSPDRGRPGVVFKIFTSFQKAYFPNTETVCFTTFGLCKFRLLSSFLLTFWVLAIVR